MSSSKNLVIALLLLGACSPIYANTYVPTWPMYQGNAAHDGYIPVTLNPIYFHLRWKKKVIQDINDNSEVDIQAPAASDDKLFIISQNNQPDHDYEIVALNSYDGKVIWNNVLKLTHLNAPSYANGRLYAQSYGSLFAFDAESGQQLYESSFPVASGNALSATVFQDHVYMGASNNGGVFSYNGRTGEKDWFAYTCEGSIWTPVVNDKYVIAYSTSKLEIIDRKTGQENFISSPNGYAVYMSSPVLDEVNNLVINMDSRYYSYNEIYMNVFDLNSQNVKYSLGPGFSGQPALSKGVIYAIQNNKVAAIDENTGKTNWFWAVKKETLLSPFIVTNNMIFISTDKATYAVSLSTHQTVRKFRATGYLALANNSLFIVAKDSTVTAISLM